MLIKNQYRNYGTFIVRNLFEIYIPLWSNIITLSPKSLIRITVTTVEIFFTISVFLSHVNGIQLLVFFIKELLYMFDGEL